MPIISVVKCAFGDGLFHATEKVSGWDAKFVLMKKNIYGC